MLIYFGAHTLCQRSGLPWLNPVLVSIAIVAAVLAATRTPYALYANQTRFIHFLLGPATVALAVPLHARARALRHLIGPIAGALGVGSLVAVIAASGIGRLLGASEVTIVSLAPKSATTAIAMGIAEKVGGLPSLTAVLVILTGIVGAVTASTVLDLLRIKEASVRGFAIGLASHGIGTARAFQLDEETGAYAGLGMGLNGILTALIIPILVDALGVIP